MLQIKRFVNQLMSSNCYVLYDDATRRCVVVDPASEKSELETDFISCGGLTLDYIILTHEHTDHNWGVNALKEKYKECKLVCSDECEKKVRKNNRFYFLYYLDNREYQYEMVPADIVVNNQYDTISWNGCDVSFLITPGHSWGSMCFSIGDKLFTGDTIMPYKPYFNGRDSDVETWRHSVELVVGRYGDDWMLYPGHGEPLSLGEWKMYYYI